MVEAPGIIGLLGLGMLNLKRRPLFSVRNIAVVLAAAQTLVGIWLLPISVTLDHFRIADPDLYDAMLIWTVRLSLAGGILFQATLLCLDWIRRPRPSPGLRRRPMQVQLVLEDLAFTRKRSNICLAVLMLLGSAGILGTFWYTGNIPFFNPDTAGKYFLGFTERYVTVRPLYVLGQQLLAVTSFFMLYFCVQAFEKRSYRRAAGFLAMFLLCLAPLVLTMKRGETFYSAITYLGALVLLNRVRIVRGVAIALFLVFLAYMMDPSHQARSLWTQPTAITYAPATLDAASDAAPDAAPDAATDAARPSAKPAKRSGRTPVRHFIANSFCVEIRESARLLYNFHHKQEPYLYGRTFLASAVGFVPTTMWPFKEKYSIGRVTLRLFNGNTETSGGPRIGLLGEAYINFGVWGVLVLPILTGVLTWLFGRLYLQVYEQYQGKNKLFCMALIFLLLMHFSLGIYLGGSSTIRDGILRLGLFLVILAIILTRSGRRELLRLVASFGRTPRSAGPR